MAPRNSMRTKTWSFGKTKFGQNGLGAKPRSRSQPRGGPQTQELWIVGAAKDIVHGLFHFPKLFYYFIVYCLVSTHAISSFCTRGHVHARWTWDPMDDWTDSKHVCKHLLSLVQFGHMPYYMGSGAPWVYMSHYWHFGPFPHFSCAPTVEVLKCFSRASSPNSSRLRALQLRVASMQKPKAHLPWQPEMQFLE